MSALSELQAIAERAIGHAEAEAQATVVHEGGTVTVEITCVIDGRAAVARANGTSDEDLRRAARAAALHARRPRAWPSAGLPDPVAHAEVQGAASARPGEAARTGASAQPGDVASGEAPEPAIAVIETAIASTKGVRAAWTRARPAPTPPVPSLRPRSSEQVVLPAGELDLVLGPSAVATLLDHLRPAFGVELDLASGPLHGRIGTSVASPAVTLTTPAGGFDAEGLPRRAVTLIEHGVATGRVHDTASAARAKAQSTGHATRAAALAPLPEDLVLSPGEAPDVESLCAAVARGLYVRALSAEREADGDAFRHTTRGALLIEEGAAVAPVEDGPLVVEPLRLLAGVDALTRPVWTVALANRGSAGVPALRARASAG